jgi:hypothetical protein
MNSRPKRSISLIILGLCALGSSCVRPSLDDLTVWKAEVQSPDGRWVARARTIQNGGFGSASIDTLVDLRQSNASKPPTDVLAFNCEGPVPRPYVLDNLANVGGTINLTMKWVAPTHLDATYNGHKGELGFQVNNWDGVDISVRDVSSEPSNGKDSK